MKKIFGLMLLCATMVGFASCEKMKAMRAKVIHL